MAAEVGARPTVSGGPGMIIARRIATGRIDKIRVISRTRAHYHKAAQARYDDMSRKKGM
jgi:hypothetical protein